MYKKVLTTLGVLFTAAIAWLVYTAAPVGGVFFALAVAWIPGFFIALFVEPLVMPLYIAWLRFTASE